MLFIHSSASYVIRMLFRHYMLLNQLCSCGHRETVVGLDTLDKPARKCGRSPCGSSDETDFSLSLCSNSFVCWD